MTSPTPSSSSRKPLLTLDILSSVVCDVFVIWDRLFQHRVSVFPIIKVLVIGPQNQ